MCELCQKHGIEFIDLPCDTMERTMLDEEEDDAIVHRGEILRVNFSYEEQIARKTKNRPKVASVDKLKVGFVKYLKEKKPELLECEVEKYLKYKGHDVLWTPLYCPTLQLIELFWAA